MTQQVISEFELLRRLGEGFFGEVWHARMQPHGDVAVKRIRREVGEQLQLKAWPEIREHLLKEAENLKKAQHKHVVQVYSVHWDEREDYVYIVTELCDSSLADRIQEGPVTTYDGFLHMNHLLLGLGALHTQGMLHRDVKPSNILLKGADAKLADFGLATDELMNGYGDWNSYGPHRAPEIFEAGVTSTKTDIWATGVTAYRILNGDRWYTDEMLRLGIDWESDRARAVRTICAPRFASSLSWMPHIPDAWIRFVRKALARDSNKRHADASEMLSALLNMKRASGAGWTCLHSEDHIEWSRLKKGGRQEVVRWSGIYSDTQSCRVHTVGSSGERTRTILQGAGTRSQVLSELRDFFGSRSV